MDNLRILVTNDDGILAEGLQRLVEELSQVASVLVAAPDRERSATGHAITMFQPLRAKATEVRGAEAAYAISGTPADCVKLAVDMLFPEQIDLIVSGINRGANLGTDVLYSGTVSAALEGVMLGLPAVAFSLAEVADPVFRPVARLARSLVETMWQKTWPTDTLLNINVPQVTEALKGIKVTTLGRIRYNNPVLKREDPWGGTYYWLAGQVPEDVHAEPSDVWAINNGYVSLTPIQFDLTDYKLLDTIAGWDLRLPKARGDKECLQRERQK